MLQIFCCLMERKPYTVDFSPMRKKSTNVVVRVLYNSMFEPGRLATFGAKVNMHQRFHPVSFLLLHSSYTVLTCILSHITERTYFYHILSLYSTATQITWRRGLALGNAPDVRFLLWGYQHVCILEPPQTLQICVSPDVKLKICVGPDTNPRRQSVEYSWRWGWPWACTFHIFCVDFICVWWSTQTQYPVEYGLYSDTGLVIK